MLFLSLEARNEAHASQVHAGQQLQSAAATAALASAKEPALDSGASGAKDKKEEEAEEEEEEEKGGREGVENRVYGSAAEEVDVGVGGSGGNSDGDDAPV